MAGFLETLKKLPQQMFSANEEVIVEDTLLASPLLDKVPAGEKKQKAKVIAEQLANNPKLNRKLNKLFSKVESQGELGGLMAVQEVIGAIPIPELPDLLNGLIDMGVQGAKTVSTGLTAADTAESEVAAFEKAGKELGVSIPKLPGSNLLNKATTQFNTAKQKFQQSDIGKKVIAKANTAKQKFKESDIGKKAIAKANTAKQKITTHVHKHRSKKGGHKCRTKMRKTRRKTRRKRRKTRNRKR